ncbi:MAG: hypothetical protein E6G57_12175 [Actinobacteria bacterium]|nr:MAG: hypothetical protein E6G57_12175 [Actinomycetota bacterium]
MLLDDYSSPFEPDFHLTRLSRRALAVLGREWLLHGHLQDRVGMPQVMAFATREQMQDIAIVEWMAASAIYSPRTQRALNFEPGTVATILKNIQLDIGAPHHFMDFRCRVHDDEHGEFWLAHCGALMDVEPMGEEFVQGMCHDIEDPTFDATAAMSHPQAQIRPLHRPPRTPADRHPHCHWTVTINHDAEPVAPHPNAAIVARSKIASIDLEMPAGNAEPGGWADYSGDFDPDFELEDLSHRALVVALQEVAVQSHLLFRCYLLAVAQAFGEDKATAAAPGVFTGLAGLTAQRLVPAMKIGGDGADAVAKLLQVHPMFWPHTYVKTSVDVLDDDRVRFALLPCPALDEDDDYTWFAQLGGDGDRALDAIVQAVNPRAVCHAVATAGAERLAFEAIIERDAEPAREAPEIGLAKFSSGASFVFTPRRPVRV